MDKNIKNERYEATYSKSGSSHTPCACHTPSYFYSCDKQIRQYCTALSSTLSGAHGFMSSKSIASLKLVYSGLQRLYDTIRSYEVPGVNVNLFKYDDPL